MDIHSTQVERNFIETQPAVDGMNAVDRREGIDYSLRVCLLPLSVHVYLQTDITQMPSSYLNYYSS